MTDKERELLIICARICAEGRGQQGAIIMNLVDSITDEAKFVGDISEPTV